MVVTTQLLKEAITAEGRGVDVLAEPAGRNTAPCVYWAARTVAAKDPKGVMLVMPSDHYIAEPQKFISVVEAAARWAFQKDELVTLGIPPTRPETGYGYLKVSDALHENVGFSGVRHVEAFVEKPTRKKPTSFFRQRITFGMGHVSLACR